MKEQGIEIEVLPDLRHPILVAGFDGWGNAMGVSSGIADYLIQKLQARYFGRLNADLFFRYDHSRPVVTIANGSLKSLTPPSGKFYAATEEKTSTDLIILKCDEPALRWHQFADDLFELTRQLGVALVVTIGSMYDNVLHSDRIVSGLASNDHLSALLKETNIFPIQYQGPSAVHSILQQEGQKRLLDCISLWAHCPYYLQGTIHYGMLATVSSLVATIGTFELNVADLENRWQKLDKQIQKLIGDKPELREMIQKLRKDKQTGAVADGKPRVKDEKVINLMDFLEPKTD